MDAAFVEAAAYILDKAGNQSLLALDLRKAGSGETYLQIACKLSDSANVYVVDSSIFLAFPKNRIAYSVGSRISSLLKSNNLFEPAAGTARQGLATWDDFRFVRAFWEIPPSDIGSSRIWEFLAKGGAFSRYLCNVHLLMKWSQDGLESRAINVAKNGTDAQARQASNYWRRPGLTYSIRSQRGFSARVLPKGCLFTGQGPLIVSESSVSNDFILGWINSSFIRTLLEMQSNDGKFMSGLVKSLPWREPNDCGRSQLEQETRATCSRLIENDSIKNITSTYFSAPMLGSSISECCLRKVDCDNKVKSMVLRLDELWNDYVCKLYGVSSDTVQALREQIDFEDNGIHHEDEEPEDIDTKATCSMLLDYVIGTVVGRWDIRFSKGEKPTPEFPDPFAPLPVCPPGMLQNADGLPAGPGEVPSNYPLRISWPGILVNDPDHTEDIERRVHQVLEVIWKERDEAIKHEACEILGVRSLREYFSKPNGFFADHLKRYSKSRRQAPIYWPLSSSSGSYTVWVYYQQLNDDFLFKIVNEFVTPKVYEAEKRFAKIETDLQRATGHEATRLRDAFEETKSFMAELQDFKAELLRVAELPYKPNLNDGVLITAAPLWKLFRLPKWRKDLKECWEQLEAGEYDWANLAYSIWPERVRQKCKSDRSLAIAHGLEQLCETRPPGATSDARRNRKAKAAAPAES